MESVEDVIGVHAGRIWESIRGNGASTPSEISKRTKLKVAEVNLALGWLAREGKLSMEANGKKQCLFRLKEEA